MQHHPCSHNQGFVEVERGLSFDCRGHSAMVVATCPRCGGKRAAIERQDLAPLGASETVWLELEGLAIQALFNNQRGNRVTDPNPYFPRF